MRTAAGVRRTDVEWHERVEEQLRVTLGKMETALAQVQDALAWSDGEGRVQWLNESFAVLSGRLRILCLSHPLEDLLPLSRDGRRLKGGEHPVREALSGASRVQGEYTLAGPGDNGERFVVLEAVPIRDRDGRVGVVVSVRDITESRRAEDRIRRANEELQRSNRELETFAYVASHDLIEPLRKIQAFGDLLLTRCSAGLSETGRDYLARMRNAASRMVFLIDGLLSYSRVTTHGRPYEPVDLDGVVREVLSDLDVALRESGVQVEAGPLPTLDADPLQMRQLFQNLLSNAIKFRRPGVPPRVWVTGRIEGEGDASACQLEVRDNGIGFEPRHADRIFKIFQRLHTRAEYPGHGIGLSICRRIVERHGGTLTAHGAPGEGARFCARLPRRQEGQVADVQ